MLNHQTDNAAQRRPAISFDYEAYAPFFDDPDVSESDKHEMLETLWTIMMAFVDLGFGLHPVQQGLRENRENCEQNSESLSDLTAAIADVVKSSSDYRENLDSVFAAAALSSDGAGEDSTQEGSS